MLTLWSPLRAACAGPEHKVGKDGAVDRWCSLLHPGIYPLYAVTPHLDLYNKEIHQSIKKCPSLQGLVDSQNLPAEQRTRYHFEAKMAPDENPMILSANITRSLGRRTSFAVTVKNVLSEMASLSGIQQAHPSICCISSTNTFHAAFDFSSDQRSWNAGVTAAASSTQWRQSSCCPVCSAPGCWD